MAHAQWWVYIIKASDSSLYTGITTDVERRWGQHCAGTGAKFFRGRRPQSLVYVEASLDRSSASKREAEIKKLPRADKLLLLQSEANSAKNYSLSNTILPR
ncbi:MAG: GIY-YIG nuclease family protein [Pseudomonadales bacterium]